MNITESQLEAYLAGGLMHSGVVSKNSERNYGLNAFRQTLGNGHYHLPFFPVFDLWMVLKKGYEIRFRTEVETDGNKSEGADRKLRMRYEREFLGRVLQSADINTAMEIAATSPNSEEVTTRLLLQLLQSLSPHFPKEHVLNPGLLREFTFGKDESNEDFEAGFFEPLIEKFLANLNANVRWGNLLHDEDLFELAHLEALNTDHLRIGCRQILEVSRHLRSTEPVQLDLATHEDGADTAFLDETHYPTGGLAGLTNRGSFENLLTSELVYLDEGTKDVSLFELRYAESELLFYLRDSGSLRRKRRSVHFILDVGQTLESKSRGYDWQYSVLLQGICLRLLHDLFEVFETDALRFHFHYLQGRKSSADKNEFFHGEIGMMKTVLADYVSHEWVSFNSNQTEIELGALIDPKRKTYAVVLAGPGSISDWRERLSEAQESELPIHAALMAVDLESSKTQAMDYEGAEEIMLPREGLSMADLSSQKNAVLRSLVS